MRNLFLILGMFFSLSIVHSNNITDKTIHIVKEEVCKVVIEKKKTISDKIPEIIEVLKIVESRNNPKAVGDNGKAKGILQIHKIYVDEVNNRYGTMFKHDEMFDPEIAKEVTELYMKFFIKYYKNKFHKDPTEQDLVRIHNGGFVKGYKIEATKIYYEKYLKQKIKLA